MLFLHRDKGIVVIKGESSAVKKILQNWIVKFNPIAKLFDDIIIDERVKAYKETFCSLVNSQNYTKAVSLNDSMPYDSVMIHKTWLKEDNEEITVLDDQTIWINKKLRDKISDQYNEIAKHDLSIDGKYVGVVVGDYVFPVCNVDGLIKSEYQESYFWEMLQKVYTTRNEGDVANRYAKQFDTVFKEKEFCQLLSNLNYNLYLEGEVGIPDKYKDFFDEVYGIDKLKYVPNCKFFTGVRENPNDKTLLGIYELEKTQTEYNLIHWVTGTEGNKAVVFSGNPNGANADLVKVYALKPSYGYYFISKFFENLFSRILKELGIAHLTNINLNYKYIEETSIEIDAIMQKADGTIVIFENKTTLSKHNIEERLNKFGELHEVLKANYPSLNIEYVMVAPYSNKSVDDGFLYFVNSKGSAEQREGFKNKMYDFKIPIAKFGNLELRCIVEPEYEKLKDKIRTIVR